MKSSNYSEIPQSIHDVSYSRVHPMRSTQQPKHHKIIEKNMPHMPKNTPNDPSSQFMQYYEQNIRLKSKMDQMTRQMVDMKQKLKVQTNVNKTISQNQLRGLAGGKKSAWCNKTQTLQKSHIGSKRFNSAYKGGNNQNVEHLLEIIDHYKEKILTSDQQINNLKRQKHILEQDVHLKQKKTQQVMESYGSQQKVDTSVHQKLKTAMRQLELEKQRNRYQEAEVKRLEAKVRALDLKSDEFSDLKAENRSLEDKIMRLTSMSGFGQVIDKGESQNKAKELEMKLKTMNEKYNVVKDSNIKLEAEVKLLKTKMVQVSCECDALEKENVVLKQQSIQNPVLQRLAKNPQLLIQVLSEIDRKGYENNKKQISTASYERILLEKQELAKQLLSARAKIDALEEASKEKERIHKQQKKQLAVSLQNAPKVSQERISTAKSGVAYDEDVSMFTEQKTNIPADINYFDIYLGELNLLETMVRNMGGAHKTQAPMVLATVDFYNHNTMHSKAVQGYQCDLQSQFSFKVNEDQFFFKYLNKGQFQIDIWIHDGVKNNPIGKVTLELKQLVSKCKARVAPVLATSVPIYYNQKVMGSINLVMRMRLPIYEKIQKLSAVGPSMTQPGGENADVRKLVIHIQEGKGFPDKSNTFVYYPFRLEDHYTKTYKGANPLWNHFKMIELSYNTDLKNYIRKNDLQFTVFDDNAIMSEHQNSDVIGTGSISLIPLLENQQIRQKIEIRKKKQLKGTIDIKIFWHDAGVKDDKIAEKPVDMLQKIHEEINKYLFGHHMKADDAFHQIDSNKTGMVSFNQFHVWLLKIMPHIKIEDVNNYYNTIKQPCNLINFVTRIEEKPKKNSDLIAQFGAINKFFKENSVQIKKKQTMAEFLRGKDLLTVSLDIDKDQNGKISKAELLKYLEANNIEAQVKDEEIYLVEFLKKYQS